MATPKHGGRKVPHLYHLTSGANLASIAAEGLDPSRCREPAFRSRGIYLAADAGHALGYCNHHGDWDGEALLRVSIADLDENLFEPDDVDLPNLTDDDVTWQRGLFLSGQCKYAGVVDAAHVEVNFEGDWVPLADLHPAPSP